MILLSPTWMHCWPFIWPLIQSPGIYYPISLLVKASIRDDRHTVPLFFKSGHCGRRKRKEKYNSPLYCFAFVKGKISQLNLVFFFCNAL